MAPCTPSTVSSTWDRHGNSLLYQQIKLLLIWGGEYESVVEILVTRDIPEVEVKASSRIVLLSTVLSISIWKGVQEHLFLIVSFCHFWTFDVDANCQEIKFSLPYNKKTK